MVGVDAGLVGGPIDLFLYASCIIRGIIGRARKELCLPRAGLVLCSDVPGDVIEPDGVRAREKLTCLFFCVLGSTPG